jgi:uncharacterized membrane protein (UPF0127 family)
MTLGKMPATQSGIYCVFNETRESFLSLKVTVANTLVSRVRRLLRRRMLEAGEGIWVVPSHGTHTFGLRHPIDILFLDPAHRVIHAIESLAPSRFSPWRFNSSSILELPVRTIYTSQTEIGDRILISRPEEMAERLRRRA